MPYVVSELFETTALLLLLVLSLSWPIVIRQPFGLSNELNWITRFVYVVPIVAGALGGIIALTRIRLRPVLFLCSSVTWVGFCGWVSLGPYLGWVQEFRQIYEYFPGGKELLPHVIIPSMLFQAARLFFWALVPFLIGIYAVRHKFTWPRFVAGSVVTGYLMALPLLHVNITLNYWLIIQPLVFTALGIITLLLPLQRAALERLFGFPLHPGFHEQVVRRNSLSAFVGYAVVVLITAILTGLLIAGYFERKQNEMEVKGPQYAPRSPSEVNAYDIMRQGGLVIPVGHRWLTPAIEQGLMKSCFRASGCFGDVRNEESWKRFNIARVKEGLLELTPWFDAFTSASQCDYIQLPSPTLTVNLSLIRELARALDARSLIALHEGDTTSSLRDIATVIAFGGIMKDYPALNTQMMSVAIRGIAVSGVYDFYVIMRHNPAAMDQLAQMLDDQRSNIYLSLDVNALRRGEPELSMITIDGGSMPYILVRANMNTLGRYMQYQQLTIATALERYFAKYGCYPDRQEQLVPEFIHRVPLDPYRGKPYAYSVANGEFSLTLEGVDTAPFEGPLEFPAPP